MTPAMRGGGDGSWATAAGPGQSSMTVIVPASDMNVRDIDLSPAAVMRPFKADNPTPRYLFRGFFRRLFGPRSFMVTLSGAVIAAGLTTGLAAAGAVAARSASTKARSSTVTSGLTPNQSWKPRTA